MQKPSTYIEIHPILTILQQTNKRVWCRDSRDMLVTKSVVYGLYQCSLILFVSCRLQVPLEAAT